MSEAAIRVEGKAGRITLNRPAALNALSYQICLDVLAALEAWAGEDAVELVLIDAVGDKAFCAGGDLQAMYDHGRAGDPGLARRFWADEYRMNAALARFPKPVVSFMQGYTMGGGVGLGCHCAHRIVGESSAIAMPETSIGLVPDVGGSLLLAEAPGQLGTYLGLTAARMGPGDAIYAGFADHYIPRAAWPELKAQLVATGDPSAIMAASEPAPPAALAENQAEIDRLFAGATLAEIAATLRAADGPLATEAMKRLSRNAPLALGAAIEMRHRLRAAPATIEAALALEYRYTYRAVPQGDFLEGIRAAIIDKDRAPIWTHTLDSLPQSAVEEMLAPLGPDELNLEKTP